MSARIGDCCTNVDVKDQLLRILSELVFPSDAEVGSRISVVLEQGQKRPHCHRDNCSLMVDVWLHIAPGYVMMTARPAVSCMRLTNGFWWCHSAAGVDVRVAALRISFQIKPPLHHLLIWVNHQVG